MAPDMKAALEQEGRRSDWRPIETAPKDGTNILLFGLASPTEDVRMVGLHVVSGYFDRIDDAWCGSYSTWLGPFVEPTHWQPLPEPPPPQGAETHE